LIGTLEAAGAALRGTGITIIAATRAAEDLADAVSEILRGD
jgi:hypothetical protein